MKEAIHRNYSLIPIFTCTKHELIVKQCSMGGCNSRMQITPLALLASIVCVNESDLALQNSRHDKGKRCRKCRSIFTLPHERRSTGSKRTVGLNTGVKSFGSHSMDTKNLRGIIPFTPREILFSNEMRLYFQRYVDNHSWRSTERHLTDTRTPTDFPVFPVSLWTFRLSMTIYAVKITGNLVYIIIVY